MYIDVDDVMHIYVRGVANEISSKKCLQLVSEVYQAPPLFVHIHHTQAQPAGRLVQYLAGSCKITYRP